jgi:hypothetical protein
MAYALCLYRAKPSATRVIIARFLICFAVNVVLQQFIMAWQYTYLGNPEKAKDTIMGIMTQARIFKNLFFFPIETVVITLFLKVLIPVTSRMKLTYGGSTGMDFTKKQIVALVLLFVVGVGAVLAYLPVYYSEYSYSSKYSVSERIEKNQSMQPIVLENTDDWDDVTTMTCVESAYGKFMSKEITYTVAIYTVADGTEMNDEIWKLSKSKAAKHEALTRVATATIVVNDKTGEVVSFVIE